VLHFRQAPRAPATNTIASLVLDARTRDFLVRDISVGGLFICDLPPEVDEFEFVLNGPGLRRTGRGAVAHRSAEGAGIAVQTWAAGTGSHRFLSALPGEQALAESFVSDWA
jgi:hypothetical protein